METLNITCLIFFLLCRLLREHVTSLSSPLYIHNKYLRIIYGVNRISLFLWVVFGIQIAGRTATYYLEHRILGRVSRRVVLGSVG